MNRRKATLIAAGATFLLLVAGIAGGSFGGTLGSIVSAGEPSRAALAASLTPPDVTGDPSAPAVSVVEPRSQLASYDDHEDDDDGPRRSSDNERREGERHEDERRKSEDR